MGNQSSTPPPAAAPLLEPAIQGNLEQIEAAVGDFLAMIQGPSGAAATTANGRLESFLNQQDAAGNSAIHGAVFSGHLAVVEYLANKGASLELPNDLGCTPLWLAAGYNRTDVLDFLLDRLPKEALIISNKRGDSPLLAAASKGHRAVCSNLLSAAAKHEISIETLQCHKNKNLDTPLSVAIAGGFGEDLLDILYHESIINHANQKGVTPLLVACERDWVVLVRRLIEKGASVNNTDANGDTTLGVAAFCGSENVVEYLLQQEESQHHHVFLNRQNERSGCTPLWLATRAGHVQCARRLLQAGANTDLANADGLTPLQAAEKFHRQDLVELLQGHEQSKKSAQ